MNAVPSPYAEPDRYRGRPLLVLLENYVLDCIGELPPETQELVRTAVQRAFGGGADWRATLREQLDMEAGLDDELRTLWDENRQQPQRLNGVQFAKLVADENFADRV